MAGCSIKLVSDLVSHSLRKAYSKCSVVVQYASSLALLTLTLLRAVSGQSADPAHPIQAVAALNRERHPHEVMTPALVKPFNRQIRKSVDPALLPK
jgi:hypothetical protein